MFFCEIYDFCKNAYFEEHLWMIASRHGILGN